jgi:single-strand DNA-binding protein
MNKVMLIGNVGVDPDVRYVDSDVAVATVRLATTEKRDIRCRMAHAVPDRTDWHNLVFLSRNLAKIVEQYVHKGDKLYVEGRRSATAVMTTSKVSKDMLPKYYVENMEMLTPRGSSSSQTNTPSSAEVHNPEPEGQNGQTTDANEKLPF